MADKETFKHKIVKSGDKEYHYYPDAFDKDDKPLEKPKTQWVELAPDYQDRIVYGWSGSDLREEEQSITRDKVVEVPLLGAFINDKINRGFLVRADAPPAGAKPVEPAAPVAPAATPAASK